MLYEVNKNLCVWRNSVPILNRCVPEPVTTSIKGFIREVYAVLNSWDLGEQVLSSVFSSWKYIAGLTALSLGNPTNNSIKDPKSSTISD